MQDLGLCVPENRSIGWHYVLDFTEGWVKNQQPWPANIQKEKKEEEAKRKEDGEKQQQIRDQPDNQESRLQQESEWKRNQGEGGMSTGI